MRASAAYAGPNPPGTDHLPRNGAETAEDIYLAVGECLSYWEAAEDMLMKIFDLIVGDVERTAIDLYISTNNRYQRNKMIKSMLNTYKERISLENATALREIMKQLDQLVLKRNDITHGFCSEYNLKINDEPVMTGFYLVPNMEDRRQQGVAPEYAYSADDIILLTAETRNQRAKLIDIYLYILGQETNNRRALTLDEQLIVARAKMLVRGQIPNEQIKYNLMIPNPYFVR